MLFSEITKAEITKAEVTKDGIRIQKNSFLNML